MFKLIFTEDFNNDLHDIFIYISENLSSLSSAKKLMRKIRDSIKYLKSFPFSCPICENQNGQNERRKLTVGNYIILYEVNEQNKTVILLNCVYARTDYINII